MISFNTCQTIIFNSDRSIAKGEKLDRWNKIAQSAMKQSLRSYLPKIQFVESVEKINQMEGKKYIFEQKAELKLIDLVHDYNLLDENNFFIFGPEGGLTDKEIESIDNSELLLLTSNRLRTETAVVAAASSITS